jgi:hypothetical protein
MILPVHEEIAGIARLSHHSGSDHISAGIGTSLHAVTDGNSTLTFPRQAGCYPDLPIPTVMIVASQTTGKNFIS